MKKVFPVAVVIFVLLALGACAGGRLNELEALSINNPDEAGELCIDELEEAGRPNEYELNETEVPNFFDDSDEMMRIYFSADWPAYASIEELTTRAAGIVRAEVLDERVEWLNFFIDHPPEIDPYRPYTVYRIQVLEVFQGDVAPGDILEVAQRGGQLDNMWMINQDKIPIASGDDLVFFLNSVCASFPAGFMTPFQGVYRFPDGDTRSLNDDEELESVHPEDVSSYLILTLTIGDLLQIQEENRR